MNYNAEEIYLPISNCPKLEEIQHLTNQNTQQVETLQPNPGPTDPNETQQVNHAFEVSHDDHIIQMKPLYNENVFTCSSFNAICDIAPIESTEINLTKSILHYRRSINLKMDEIVLEKENNPMKTDQIEILSLEANKNCEQSLTIDNLTKVPNVNYSSLIKIQDITKSAKKEIILPKISAENYNATSSRLNTHLVREEEEKVRSVFNQNAGYIHGIPKAGRNIFFSRFSNLFQ